MRTLTGTLVWNYHGICDERKPLADSLGRAITWRCRTNSGSIVAPGVYYMLIHYGGALTVKKILVRGD